jgi:hypothetical protein
VNSAVGLHDDEGRQSDGEAAFTEARGSDGDAPIPDLPAVAPERGGSTHICHLLTSAFSPLVERNIFEGWPRAPMHFPDAGRPVFISRDAKLEAHEKRGTGVRK